MDHQRSRRRVHWFRFGRMRRHGTDIRAGLLPKCEFNVLHHPNRGGRQQTPRIYSALLGSTPVVQTGKVCPSPHHRQLLQMSCLTNKTQKLDSRRRTHRNRLHPQRTSHGIDLRSPTMDGGHGHVQYVRGHWCPSGRRGLDFRTVGDLGTEFPSEVGREI